MTYQLILQKTPLGYCLKSHMVLKWICFILLCFPKCFHIPCVVENFPMKERSPEEMEELKRVLQQKKTEAECLKV